MIKQTQAHIPVSIHLVSSVEQEGQKDIYEMMLSGKFYEQGQLYVLEYEERQEEGSIHTTIEFSKDRAAISRSGAVNINLPFHREEALGGAFTTPQGSVPITTETKKLSHSHTYGESTLKGTFQIDYSLHVQEQTVGKYSLEIQFNEK
ncbi:DUF1934 domain-containing protein [Bacillus thermotolerans]|nr:DUF1934 domain-containing protein [Bacillus thermotolerans]KKB36488.1 hypothetical protein QY97_00887 [Bacillus thermotolerans]